MKKLLSMILVVLLALSMVACATENSGNEDNKATASATATEKGNAQPTPTATASGNGEETKNPESTQPASGDNGESQQPEETPDNIKPMDYSAEVKGEPGISYEGVWLATDATNGVLEFAEVQTAPEDVMAGMGLKGTLAAKQISVYEATVAQNVDGTYVIQGTLKAVKMAVEGEDAKTFIDLMKQSLGTDDPETIKMLNGETLTAKEEIEKITYEIDSKIQVVCTESNGTFAIKEFTKEYTERGSMIDTKKVYKIEDGVIRTIEEYENGELDVRKEYRADGTQSKATWYDEGEVSFVDEFDENGDLIQEGPSFEFEQ